MALELEWVLRGYYGFPVEQVLQVFDHLLAHPSLTVEDRQPWSRPWPVYATGSTSPMPCTMPAAGVVRQWRRLMIVASGDASASSISRHACLCRQVPEGESGSLWANQL